VLSLALTGTAGALLTVVLVAGIAMLWFTSFA
jgi:hypothetical protein